MIDTSFDIAAARVLAEQALERIRTPARYVGIEDERARRVACYADLPALCAQLVAACAELEQARNILAQLSPAERKLAEIEAASGLPPIPWREQ